MNSRLEVKVARSKQASKGKEEKGRKGKGKEKEGRGRAGQKEEGKLVEGGGLLGVDTLKSAQMISYIYTSRKLRKMEEFIIQQMFFKHLLYARLYFRYLGYISEQIR